MRDFLLSNCDYLLHLSLSAPDLLLYDVVWVEEFVGVQFLADAYRSRNIEEALIHVKALMRRELDNGIPSTFGPRFVMKRILVIVIGHIEVLHGNLAVILNTLLVCHQILLTQSQFFLLLAQHRSK